MKDVMIGTWAWGLFVFDEIILSILVMVFLKKDSRDSLTLDLDMLYKTLP